MVRRAPRSYYLCFAIKMNMFLVRVILIIGSINMSGELSSNSNEQETDDLMSVCIIINKTPQRLRHEKYIMFQLTVRANLIHIMIMIM